MPEYIDIDKNVIVYDTRERKCEVTVRHILLTNRGEFEVDDVRPVVFCKDCKHRGNTPDCPFCWLADKKMGDDHFCSFGEKREES